MLHRCGRRNDPALVERILAALKTPALRQPEPVVRALEHAVLGLIGVITAMQVGVQQLEAALVVEFDAHPLALVLRSAPGLRPVLAARVLAEVSEDAARFTSATGLCGACGSGCIANVRRPCSLRPAFGIVIVGLDALARRRRLDDPS